MSTVGSAAFYDLRKVIPYWQAKPIGVSVTGPAAEIAWVSSLHSRRAACIRRDMNRACCFCARACCMSVMDCTQSQSVDIQPAIVPRLPSVAASVVNSIAAHFPRPMSNCPTKIASHAVCGDSVGLHAPFVDATTTHALHVWLHSIVM